MTTEQRTTAIGPPVDDDDVRAFRVLASESLLFELAPDVPWPAGDDLKHLQVAKEEGRVVGGYIAWQIGQVFGGRGVPMAALRAVAVAPAQRGKGLADRMMRRALLDAAANGSCIATLFPATQGLYRKTGYEVAGHRVLYRVPLAAIPAEHRGDATIVEGTGADLPTLRALHAERARQSNGHLERSAEFWQRMIAPPGQAQRKVHLLVDGGIPVGYALTSARRDASSQKGDLWLYDHVVATAGAARTLRAFVADHRSVIKDLLLFGAPAEPLWLPLEEQRMQVVDWQRWMLRLTDVPAALEARGYPEGLRAELALDVDDPVLPKNAGRIVLSVEGGRGRVHAGGDGALRAHVRGLASLYASYLSPHELKATGLVDGDAAALDVARAIFAGPQPYMTEMF